MTVGVSGVSGGDIVECVLLDDPDESGVRESTIRLLSTEDTDDRPLENVADGDVNRETI